jgi:hypothetical protein
LTAGNLQSGTPEKFRKDDTLTKGKTSIDKGTFDQHVSDDEVVARDDGDSGDGTIGSEGVDTHHSDFQCPWVRVSELLSVLSLLIRQ